MASKNLRYSEGVLVSHVGSLIDARILYLTVKNGCISNYIITYKMMNNCLLIIFQQALIKYGSACVDFLTFKDTHNLLQSQITQFQR